MKPMTDEQIADISMECNLVTPSDFYYFARAIIEARDKQWREALLPVANADAMPGTQGFTMACFRADEVAAGSLLYILKAD